MRETGSNSLEKKQKREFVRAEIDNQYSMTKICPKCGTTMVYAYGEMYECPKCGDKEYTDFGKIREYLETHGPQNAVTIADATGAQMLMFSTCHNVTKDEFESGVTFIDLMQQNADTLKKALE